MNSLHHFDRIFRHPLNPILSAADWPYPVHTVFNPGAVRLKDGTTLLLCRVEDRRGFSHLSAARSENGVTDWHIDPAPTFAADPDTHPDELWGVEDPRITYVPDRDEYVIAYTAFSASGPGVALATTRDFKTYERLGLVCPPDDKDAALFPVRFSGEYALVHRPHSPHGSHIHLSYSRDLVTWRAGGVVLPARRGAWWDANKIGLSPPPILTERGWLMLYHGVRHHASGSIYRLGLALFDRDRPDVCLRRGQPWIFGPEASYEVHGDVGSAVFPCGTTLGDDGDTLNIYYGAADSCIGLATASVGELLAWLDEHGSDLTGTAGLRAEIPALDAR